MNEQIDGWGVEMCCEFIADAKGWKYATSGWHASEAHDGTEYQIQALADDPVYYRLDRSCAQRNHPIPATLDAIAGALPEGYFWEGIIWDAAESWWAVDVMGRQPAWAHAPHHTIEAMKLAMARACCKAWAATAKAGVGP